MGAVETLSAASALKVVRVESKDVNNCLTVTVEVQNFRGERDILLLLRRGEAVYQALAARDAWQENGKLDPRTRFVVSVIPGRNDAALLVFGFQFP